MPTRYMIPADFDLKTMVTDEKMASVKSRKELKKELRNYLSTKYSGGPKKERTTSVHTKFLFTKLHF